MSSCSCVLQVGITVSAAIILVGLVAVVTLAVLIYKCTRYITNYGKLLKDSSLLSCVLLCSYLRKSKSDSLSNDLVQSKDTTQVYEDPDKLDNRGQGNYELTQCPAYESTTSKPQPAQEDSHYEL